MRAYFEYKGINSIDMHIHIENDISFPSPEADVEFVEVPGRDGELAVSNNRLKGVRFPIPITLKLPAEKTVEQAATDISNWLKNDIGWFSLRFSGSPEYEYMAMFYEQFDVKETIKTYGKAILTFRLKPYKRVRGIGKMNLSNGQTLVNLGTRKAKPILYIEGNGAIVFQNNGVEWLSLKSVDSRIVVDSEAMTVYRDNLVQFQKMDANLTPLFPLLSLGENKITWTGNVTKVEIVPRWEAIV